MRENPPTIKANSACTGKSVAHFSRTHVASVPKESQRWRCCGNCDKERFDVLSFPGYVIKESPTHGARYGPSVRQTMYFKAHDVLKKARKPQNGNCKTILERWHDDDKYRKSLSDVGLTEEQIEQCDAIALGDHSWVATTEERSRYKNSWKISLKREGIQGPIKQRPDFIEAKHKCNRENW